MMRLIDADALKEAIKSDMYVVDYADEGAIYGMFWSGIENAIDAQPTAEKTGKWIFDKNTYSHGVGCIRCSECGHITEMLTNYCSDCGCKMEV